MSKPFDYFVIFAEMRTGSNFLEENVNSYSGLKCWGEIYNPGFIGGSGQQELEGITLQQREADPMSLLQRLKERTSGLAGFRYFHDHDLRMCEPILNDPRCAKIILTRNPLESYVSRKIASATGQWRLGDLKDARSAKIQFDKDEFDAMLQEVKSFQQKLQRGLQVSGQTAYYISYDDIQDIDVLNGLASFLGVNETHAKTVQTTKVQNPSKLEDKVSNFPQMISELSSVDHFNLSNTPNFEPRRAPNVPSFIAAKGAPLLYMPLMGGPVPEVSDWVSSLGEGAGLIEGFNQKTLRQWKRSEKEHRSFTVVSHPVVRLHRAFCEKILKVGQGSYGDIRDLLRTTYKLPLPLQSDDYTLETHREAFIQFAQFVKGNLNGQTSIRVDGFWASQVEVLKGFCDLFTPDMVLREDNLAQDLTYLANSVGASNADSLDVAEDAPFTLAETYNADVESAVRAAYQKDYMAFGFRPWR